MRRIFFFILLLSLFGLQAQKYSRVGISLEDRELKDVFSLGIPMEGALTKGVWIGEIKSTDIENLRQNGFSVEILIDDMVIYYQQRNLSEAKSEDAKNNYCPSQGLNLVHPSHFKHGSMGGYLTLDELYSEMDSMRLLFPNLISVRSQIDTFTTFNGLPMFFQKISKNPDMVENEAAILYIGLTHAREPMGMQQLVWFMWHLLENYGVDEEITYILDNLELYFVPCANPDGYLYNEQTNPNGGGMWRKNRRNNGGGNFGVDLNRNYGYEWGYDNQGSSPTASSDVYRGPSAFSEKETKAIKWLTENRSFKLAIDHHTYSNILLYPFGYQMIETDDHELFVKYSDEMTKYNRFEHGLPGSLLYNANGGSFDWLYGEQQTKNKIIAFAPESGSVDDGFWPQESRINDIVIDFYPMNMYLARFALKYAKISDVSSEVIGQQNGYLPFQFECLGMDTNAVFAVRFQALTSNISFANSVFTFENPSLNVTYLDSVAYSLSNVAQGGEFRFVMKLEYDNLIKTDTISKIFGNKESLFYDPCETLANWTSSGGNWVVTSSSFVSSPSCITDSPANYGPNLNKQLRLTNAIDLSLATWAKVNFWAKWDIEKLYDYVVFQSSIDGGTSWQPLCGKYNATGSSDQLEGMPLYDGKQWTWVREEIDLSHVLGQQVLFRYLLKTDAYTNADGFYFDDFTVEALLSENTGLTKSEAVSKVQVYPNPSHGKFNIEIMNNNYSQSYQMQVFDYMGRIVLEMPLDKSVSSFDLIGGSGFYYLNIYKNSILMYRQKIVLLP